MTEQWIIRSARNENDLNVSWWWPIEKIYFGEPMNVPHKYWFTNDGLEHPVNSHLDDSSTFLVRTTHWPQFCYWKVLYDRIYVSQLGLGHSTMIHVGLYGESRYVWVRFVRCMAMTGTYVR